MENVKNSFAWLSLTVISIGSCNISLLSANDRVLQYIPATLFWDPGSLQLFSILSSPSPLCTPLASITWSASYLCAYFMLSPVHNFVLILVLCILKTFSFIDTSPSPAILEGSVQMLYDPKSLQCWLPARSDFLFVCSWIPILCFFIPLL